MNDERLFEQTARLVPAAAQGDEAAFNELYLLTRDACFFIALSLTRKEEDALDILQESYLKAYEQLGRLENPECFVRWLHQIVANTAKRFLSRKRELFCDDLADSPLHWQPETDAEFLPEDAMDMSETRRIIMEIIDGLPEDQRLCVLLHYYSGMELSEMAEALELPLGTVKSRLYYARNKISAAMERLQKKGVKLYGAAPIPLLIFCLRKLPLPDFSAILPGAVVGASATAAAAGSVVASAGTLTAKLGAIAVPKIVAIAAAAVVAVSVPTGIAVHQYNKKAAEQPSISTTSSVVTYANQSILPVVFLPTEDETSFQETITLETSQTPTRFAYDLPTATRATGNATQNIIAANASSAPTSAAASNTSKSSASTETTSATKYSYTTSAPRITASTASSAASTTIQPTTTTATTSTTTATTTSPGVYYQTATSGTGLRITGYTGSGGVVSIPASIDGKAVLEIGMGAFQSKSLTSVTVPSSVTAIGQFAFADNPQLGTITIPASVSSIGMWAFDGCDHVTIRCAAGSVAESYAISNWIDYVLI
ncbi:MAG: sigma-70 family RNA polymerase sigma factor [Oscillospiraceae bacterium]|nr:sigma-70 family RNA polymerase sigma factor [Oscillospiraceae bacterium]